MSSSWLMRIPKSYPLAFGMVFSTFKTSFSDLLVQTTVEKRDEIDWRRNAAFASFGCFYLGGVQYLIYVPLFRRLFPSANTFPTLTLREKFANKQGMKEVSGWKTGAKQAMSDGQLLRSKARQDKNNITPLSKRRTFCLSPRPSPNTSPLARYTPFISLFLSSPLPDRSPGSNRSIPPPPVNVLPCLLRDQGDRN